jgi:hypothetical protein
MIASYQGKPIRTTSGWVAEVDRGRHEYTQGLVSFWDFNDSDILDQSGNGYDLSGYYGGPDVYETGVGGYGKCLNFYPDSSYYVAKVAGGGGTYYPYLNSNMGINVWFKTPDISTATNRYIFNAINFLTLYCDNEHIGVLIVYYDLTGAVAVIDIDASDRTYLYDNNWHMLSVSLDGTKGIDIYVDVSKYTASDTFTKDASISNPAGRGFAVGTYNSTTNNWLGCLDQMRIYETPLSLDTIKNLYRYKI